MAAVASDERVVFAVGPLDRILLDGVPCETATLTNTDTIRVEGKGGTREEVGIDLSGGRFEPGATPEPSGTSEIEFSVSLSNDAGDRIWIVGTAGPDVMLARAAGIDLNGDGDDDAVAHGVREIDLAGEHGDDTLGGAGSSGESPRVPMQISGGPGNDVVSGGVERDALDGGAGRDTVRFTAADRVQVDLGLGIATGHGRDRIDDVEDVVGSPGPDRLLGDDGSNRLTGGAGNDRLSGSNGDDDLVGGPGKDFLKPGGGDDVAAGAGGNDTCSLRSAPRPVTIDLREGVAEGEGTDTLEGIESAVGSRAADVIRGTDARNRRLVGAGGDDHLFGRRGSDRLRGGPGDDLLRGGNGDDELAGGPGTDRCLQDEGRGPRTECELGRASARSP